VSGPPQGAADTVPAVRMAGVFDAAQAAKSAAGWRRPPGAPAPVLFVSDIVQEHARVSAIASQRFQYEEVRHLCLRISSSCDSVTGSGLDVALTSVIELKASSSNVYKAVYTVTASAVSM
jgi:hypothetical protein